MILTSDPKLLPAHLQPEVLAEQRRKHPEMFEPTEDFDNEFYGRKGWTGRSGGSLLELEAETKSLED